MCFNPSPERRVPSPNRYMAFARFCFCKNNKRTITKLDRQLEAAWKADGGTATVDAILTLSSGGLTIGKADNIGNRKSAALGSGYVQYTVAQFKEVERDELRFAGGSTKNLLMLPSMQEKDVATITIADCLPNLEDAEYLTARRDDFLEEVLGMRRQVLQVGEGVARSATKRFTLMASSSVPYKAAAGAVRRLRATPHGKKCGGSHLHSGGISMDYGMAADWSKSSTVSGFTTRVGATAAKTFLKTPKSGTVWAGEEEHPMKFVPNVMAGDGKPVSQVQKIGQCPDSHRVGKPWDAGQGGIFGVVAENGGFHVCLKTMELIGATYGPRSAGPRGWNGGAGMLTSKGGFAVKPKGL